MRLLGVDRSTFPELFPASRDAMSSAYPELSAVRLLEEIRAAGYTGC